MAGGGTELNSINGFHHPEFNVSESSDRPQTFNSAFSYSDIKSCVCVQYGVLANVSEGARQTGSTCFQSLRNTKLPVCVNIFLFSFPWERG